MSFVVSLCIDGSELEFSGGVDFIVRLYIVPINVNANCGTFIFVFLNKQSICKLSVIDTRTNMQPIPCSANHLRYFTNLSR